MEPIATIISSFNKPKWVNKNYEECALRLVKSLRKNGGKCKDLPIIFWIDGDIGATEETLNRLLSFENVGCIYGKCYHSAPSREGSWFHKLEAVNAVRPITKYSLWIDCDNYILRDFSELFLGEFDISAAPVNFQHNFGASQEFNSMWDQYYEYFKVKRSSKKILTAIDRKPGNFYFSSGIMVYRNTISFADYYRKMSIELYESGLPYCEKRFTQTILSIIIDKFNYRWRIIPKKYAYVYHLNDYKLEESPAIVHYCDNRVKEIPDEDWNI